MEETTKSRKAPAKPRKTAAKKTTAKAETPEIAPAANGNAAAATVLTHPARNGSSSAPPKPVSISRDDIAKLAHKYWSERGHQHGHAVEDWLRAERELQKRAS